MKGSCPKSFRELIGKLSVQERVRRHNVRERFLEVDKLLLLPEEWELKHPALASAPRRSNLPVVLLAYVSSQVNWRNIISFQPHALRRILDEVKVFSFWLLQSAKFGIWTRDVRDSKLFGIFLR
jgi:hypothetical protein